MQPSLEYQIREPKFSAVMELKIQNQETVRYSSDEVPMSIQDAYMQVVGDGKARVAVTVDVGIKDFGTGVSSSCTVSLTCGQDQATLQRAAELAGSFARDFAKENQARAEMELQQLIGERQRQIGR